MKLWTLMVLPFLWCGCTAPQHTASTEPAPQVTTAKTPEAALTVDSFGFIGLTTTVPELIRKLGQPERVSEGSLTVYVYRLVDNTEVRIGVTSPERILFVRYRGEVLFQR